ncbi:Hypothetical protein POVN_LOCUS154 [uncultured virus]|nr:Hypothetical protein POVN_LOCUS154 [uncultured virus]
MEPWKLIFAGVVCTIFACYLLVFVTDFTFFTIWVLVLFTLYLVVYMLGLTWPTLDATIFTLALIILVGYVVVLLANLFISGGRRIFQHEVETTSGFLGLMVFLLLLHIIPFVTLYILNAKPTVLPYYGLILIILVIYSCALYLIKGFGPASEYSLPEAWWSYVLMGLAVVGVVVCVTVYILSRP